MYKIIGASILAMMLMGAGCEKTKTNYVEVPGEPVYVEVPVVTVPDEPIDADHPTVGTGSVNYTPTCETSFAKVKYVYEEDSTIDSNSFVVVHSEDGTQKDIHTAAGNHNGAVMIMEDNVLIVENETEDPIAHQIEIEFISDGHSQVNSFAFIQPECGTVKPDPESIPDQDQDPEVDPTPDPKPIPEPIPDPDTVYYPYASYNDYMVGDDISIVDDTGVTRYYECVVAYRSGKKDTWKQFEKESDNWSNQNHGDTSLNMSVKIR